ncbi:MAG: hypothetical protein VZR28_12740, partial [Candidatus Cryptobacteroides sp.]|nr:hypothetical protein [Candidatus Cryptobacteroides sp.]
RNWYGQQMVTCIKKNPVFHLDANELEITRADFIQFYQRIRAQKPVESHQYNISGNRWAQGGPFPRTQHGDDPYCLPELERPVSNEVPNARHGSSAT